MHHRFDLAVRLETGYSDSWVAVGSGGWIYWFFPDWHDVRVRMSIDEELRPVVKVVFLKATSRSRPTVAATELRELPLGRLQSFMSSTAHWHALMASLDSDGQPCFDPCVSGDPPEPEALQLPLKSLKPTLRINPDGERRPPAGGSAVDATGWSLPLLASGVEPRPGRARSDGFYLAVADSFLESSLASTNPAAAMAAANNVKTTTVHGWMKEARRRGLLSPARRKDATIPPARPS